MGGLPHLPIAVCEILLHDKVNILIRPTGQMRDMRDGNPLWYFKWAGSVAAMKRVTCRRACASKADREEPAIPAPPGVPWNSMCIVVHFCLRCRTGFAPSDSFPLRPWRCHIHFLAQTPNQMPALPYRGHLGRACGSRASWPGLELVAWDRFQLSDLSSASPSTHVMFALRRSRFLHRSTH
jgi:hypothetical protein